MKTFLERGGAWVVVQLLLFAVLIILGFRYPGPDSTVWRGIGGCVLLLAGAVAIAGSATLGRNLTPFPQPVEHSKLVQHGIYSKIRHPLYTAVILAGFGWAMVWVSWPAAVVAALLIPFFHAKSCHEERFLRQKFPEYCEYESRTRRFIPWVY